MKSSRWLSACIRIEWERISRGVNIPCGIYFELDRNHLEKIETLIKKGGSLELQPQQLNDLRYYGLINSPHIQSDRSCLIFASNYLSHGDRLSPTVIRSTIDFTGSISQEIQREFWHYSSLASRVIAVHYWLTVEILRQLPITNQRNVFSIPGFWCFCLTLAMAIWYLLPFQFLINLVLMVILVLLLKLLISYSIPNYLKPWLLEQLITGFFAQTTYKRQWGLKFLALIA